MNLAYSLKRPYQLMIGLALLSLNSIAQTVTNGSVTGAPRGNSLVANAAGWSGCSFSPDLCDITHPSYVTSSAVTTVPSPDGGTWVGLASLGECAQTSITGLTIGNSYTLYFCGACFGTGTSIYNGSPAQPVITVVGATAGTQQFTIPMAGSTWNNYQMTFTATATSHVLQTSHPSSVNPNAYASLDGFSLSAPCGILLPVELFDFNAKLQENNEVLLGWKTISERNSTHFAIERSANGIEFVEVGRVDANGNSLQTIFYNFIDDKLPNKTAVYYYRIRSFEANETSILSDIRAVSLLAASAGAINVYPNPANLHLNIDLWCEAKGPIETEYVIINTLGQFVQQNLFRLNYGTNKLQVDIDELAKGSYIIEFKIGVTIYRKKFIKN